MLPNKTTPQKQNLADLTVLAYGRSKIGKSDWCSHSEGALFLATEPGLNALDVYQVPIQSWSELLAAGSEIAEGKHSFKTIVIDTIDNAYRMCAEHVCAKFKIEHESDLGYGKGWALINNEFHRVLTKLAFLPYGLFLVSHSVEREIETRTGKYTRIVPTLPDKARKIVLGMVDLILYCDLESRDRRGGQGLLPPCHAHQAQSALRSRGSDGPPARDHRSGLHEVHRSVQPARRSGHPAGGRRQGWRSEAPAQHIPA